MEDQMTAQDREFARMLHREPASLAAENARRLMAKMGTERAQAIRRYAEELSELRRRDDAAQFAR